MDKSNPSSTSSKGGKSHRLQSVVVKPPPKENVVRALIKANRKEFLAVKEVKEELAKEIPNVFNTEKIMCNSLAERVANDLSISLEQLAELKRAQKESYEFLERYAEAFEEKARLNREGFEAREALDKAISAKTSSPDRKDKPYRRWEQSSSFRNTPYRRHDNRRNQNEQSSYRNSCNSHGQSPYSRRGEDKENSSSRDRREHRERPSIRYP